MKEEEEKRLSLQEEETRRASERTIFTYPIYTCIYIYIYILIEPPSPSCNHPSNSNHYVQKVGLK